nr:hypothetical protein FVER53263_09916 [Fusarium verticillioides]
MDPLSLAASIAGLVSLGDIVFKYALRYCKSVKDAPKEVNDLLNEIKDLTLLLHNLSMVAYGHGLQTQTNPQNPATAHKPHHLHECQQLLNQLEDGLSKLEQKSGLDKVQSRLKWPFNTSVTKEMLQAIGRHKQTINIALGADSLTKLQICLSRQDETLKEIQELKVEVRKIQDIETKITLNQKRREVLSTFSKANPRLEFDNNKELRYPMTALWLTEGREFAEWVSNDEARIWCSGIPGAGKSVIAAAVIDVCLQRLLNSPNTAHESAYEVLEAYHEELHPPDQLPGQLKVRRLIKVLHEMCEIFDRVYLIVDGLDECGDNTREAVDSLSKVSLQAAKKNINMALLSRDELLIREKIEQHFHWIEIEAHTEDVQLYVASEVDRLIREKDLRLKDFSLKDEIITELVKGAKGMFRWVACQLDHLCKLPTDGARRKALNRLPPTLPATYERILLAIDQLPSKKIVRNLLLLMMIKDVEFDSLALCEAVSIEENSDRLEEDEIIDEEEILRWCGSLIRLLPQSKGTGKKFQFAHYTVQEFLESDCSDYPILKSYGISLEQAKKSLMQLSLRFLNFKNFGQKPRADQEGAVSIRQLRKTRPFYKIASVCWWSYDLEETDGMHQDHLCALFRKTPNFYSWAVEVVSQLSVFGLPGDEHDASKDVYDLDIVADLIRHGIPVEKEDPEYFFDNCFYSWQNAFEPGQFKERYNNGAPVLNVLDALASIQLSTPQQMRAQIEGKPYISLYDHAFDFARSMGLEIKKSLIQSAMSGEVGGRDLPGLVSSALQNNDTDLLEKIYCPEGSKQTALFDQQRIGFSVLHTAIQHSSLDCLELLLQWGVDPNARDERGIAPIHMCFEIEDSEIEDEFLRVLLNHGSDSLALDDVGETVWHIYARRGMYWMLELLIQQKERDSALLAVSESGNTPVCSALIQGSRATVELLLEFCDKREYWKCSEPIYRAAAKLGSAEVVQKLIDIGVQYVEIDENQGNPLHWISPTSNLKCIEILKSLFSLEQRRKSDSRTPFESLLLRTVTEAMISLQDVSVAMVLLSDDLVSSPKPFGNLWHFLWTEVVPKVISHGYLLESLGELFTQLLEKGIASAYEEHFAGSALEPLAQCICRNTIPRLRMTPLNLAVREGHTECVTVLLNHGAGQQVGHIDKSPFVHASCSGNETILNLLKDHLGDPSADGLIMNHKAERHMEFDLMLAIRHGNVDACQKLLDLGCPIDIEITPGKASGLEQSATPLMFAICERASIAVVKWLLDNNAHVSAVSWNKLKRFYCNGLSAALRDSTFNPLIPVLVTKYLEERGKFLARHGNYLSIALASRNTQGLVILLDEFSKNHKDIDIYTMLNPTLDEMNPQGPLHIAAGLNDLAAFKALVVAGADIEQLDYNGSSPLHIAAAANALSVAEYLISSGARLNPTSYHSSTPILNACLTASSQVIQLLIKSGANYQAVNDLGSNCLTLFVLTRPIRRDPLNINAFKALLDAGIDLFARNKFGLDAARSILISDTPIYLYYILNHFPRFFNNRSLSWAAIELLGEASTHSLCALFLSRKLRLIRPLLTIKEFLDLSDLSNPGRHTFFCSSVISGSVEAVRNFPKYGANIQHACPDHGTPLIAALTYRRFDIVKILLLSDAKAFTTSFLATEVPFMECDEKIKRCSLGTLWANDQRSPFWHLNDLGPRQHYDV